MSFTTWMQTSPDWKIVPTSVIFGERSEKSSDEDVHLTPSQKLGVIPQEEYIEKTGAQVVKNRLGSGNMKRVMPGDFISHLRSFQGGLEHSTIPGKVSNAYTVLKPRREIEGKYYSYLFKSSRFIEGLANFTDQLRDGQTINFARLALFSLPLPPLGIQRAIADFLDRETAEIDGMRADLDEMERLLEERQAAIIDTTITSSGTTNTVRVGYIAELITGLTYSPQDIVEDGGTVVLRSGNIQSSKITLEDVVQVSLSIPDKLQVRSGDILVCARNGSAKLVGKSAKLTSEEQGFTWGAFMTVVRSDINEWLFWYLHSSEFEHMRGDFSSSTINQLTNGTFSRIPVPIEKNPTRRNELTVELARQTAEIDSMLSDITKLRDLLAERRAALISAAVTGQIGIPVSPTHEDEAHA